MTGVRVIPSELLEDLLFAHGDAADNRQAALDVLAAVTLARTRWEVVFKVKGSGGVKYAHWIPCGTYTTQARALAELEICRAHARKGVTYRVRKTVTVWELVEE